MFVFFSIKTFQYIVHYFLIIPVIVLEVRGKPSHIGKGQNLKKKFGMSFESNRFNELIVK